MNELIIQYWYFHLPNYILAIMMYSTLGRIALSLFLKPESKNYIYRGFVWLSMPAVYVVNFITPRALPFIIVLILAVLWLYAVRVIFLLALTVAGLAPTTGL